MLQALNRPTDGRPFVDRALARFPDEPRFVLARAILTDQRWPFTGTVGGAVDVARPRRRTSMRSG